jgi:hypothetical protein
MWLKALVSGYWVSILILLSASLSMADKVPYLLAQLH